MKLHTEEVNILSTEVQSTKDQLLVTEGRLIRAEKQIDELREKLLSTEARSMRDNLMFYNIAEPCQEIVRIH